MRHYISNFLFALVFLPLVACHAEVAEPYKAGVNYEVLPEPVATADPSKIEVVEVFWYGCSHCYAFEPKLNPWVAALPEDVNFVRVPAVWHPTMAMHAKAYYTARALKVVDDLHEHIFEAMNLKKQKLKNEDEIAKLFEGQGVDPERFSKVFNSKGIEMAVDLATSKQQRYRIQGTPEMVVNGKYRISSRENGSQEGMLKVAAYLIKKERAAMNQ